MMRWALFLISRPESPSNEYPALTSSAHTLSLTMHCSSVGRVVYYETVHQSTPTEREWDGPECDAWYNVVWHEASWCTAGDDRPVDSKPLVDTYGWVGLWGGGFSGRGWTTKIIVRVILWEVTHREYVGNPDHIVVASSSVPNERSRSNHFVVQHRYIARGGGGKQN